MWNMCGSESAYQFSQVQSKLANSLTKANPTDINRDIRQHACITNSFINCHRDLFLFLIGFIMVTGN